MNLSLRTALGLGLVAGIGWITLNDVYGQEPKPALVLKASGKVNADMTVYQAVFTADSATVAARRSEGTAFLWTVADGKLVRFFGPTGPGLAFSPDSKLAYTGGNPIKAWDMKTGKELRSFKYESKVRAASILAISPDGKLLASGHETPGDVIVWDIAKSKELRVHKGEGRSIVNSLVFSPDGKFLAVGLGNSPTENNLFVWDPADGKEVAKFKGSEGVVLGISFSSDSKTLAVPQRGLAEKNAIKLVDTSTWKANGELIGHTKAVNQTAFSPDGTALYAHDEDQVVKVWDVASKAEKASIKARGTVLAVSPDGKFLAVGGGVANPPEIQIYKLPLK